MTQFAINLILLLVLSCSLVLLPPSTNPWIDVGVLLAVIVNALAVGAGLQRIAKP